MNTSEIKLELFRQIDALPENIVVELKIVVQRYLQQRNKKIALTDADINSAEIHTLLENSTSLDFLKGDEEDIYSDADLKHKILILNIHILLDENRHNCTYSFSLHRFDFHQASPSSHFIQSQW